MGRLVTANTTDVIFWLQMLFQTWYYRCAIIYGHLHNVLRDNMYPLSHHRPCFKRKPIYFCKEVWLVSLTPQVFPLEVLSYLNQEYDGNDNDDDDDDDDRELKQLRRRRKREKKTIGFMTEKKNCCARALRFLVHFFDVRCTTTT